MCTYTKIKNALIGFLIITLSSAINAETYTEPATIKGVTLGAGYVRVRLHQMLAEGEFSPSEAECNAKSYYAIDTSSESGRLFYSTILSAKLTEAKISVQLHGCFQNGSNFYPKINHVYFCENKFCG